MDRAEDAFLRVSFAGSTSISRQSPASSTERSSSSCMSFGIVGRAIGNRYRRSPRTGIRNKGNLRQPSLTSSFDELDLTGPRAINGCLVGQALRLLQRGEVGAQ